MQSVDNVILELSTDWYYWNKRDHCCLKNTCVRSRNCGCVVTWFCYQLIAKPGNKTATVSWPDPHRFCEHVGVPRKPGQHCVNTLPTRHGASEHLLLTLQKACSCHPLWWYSTTDKDIIKCKHYCDVSNHQLHHCILNRLLEAHLIHRWPVNSPHKWPVTRKMFPFDHVITNRCMFHQSNLEVDGLMYIILTKVEVRHLWWLLWRSVRSKTAMFHISTAMWA